MREGVSKELLAAALAKSGQSVELVSAEGLAPVY